MVIKKIILKEIQEKHTDANYDYYRLIKTLCLIMIIFCIGIILRNKYSNLMENSRFLKFYPETTFFYQDFKDIGTFSKLEIPQEYRKFSYGIFRTNLGEEKYLFIAQTQTPNTPIINSGQYFLFTNNSYTFISNYPQELENIQHRIQKKQFALLKDTSFRKLIKKLDQNRDNTIIVSDFNYLNLPVDKEFKEQIGTIFDKVVVETKKTNNGLIIDGEIIFKNKIAGLAANAKRIAEKFSLRKIKIENFKTQQPIIIVGVKDFDLWTKTLLQITKNLPQNQYIKTFNLIQNNFHSDIEKDIVKKLNGNAVLYIFKENEVFHPLLTVETNRNLVNQARKYFDFLQVQNKSRFEEKEIDDKIFSVLNSGFYPHNLSFANFGDNLFTLGHQNILEAYARKNPKNYFTSSGDFYIFADIQNIEFTKKHKGFWSGYKNIELKFTLAPNVNFHGYMLQEN